MRGLSKVGVESIGVIFTENWRRLVMREMLVRILVHIIMMYGLVLAVAVVELTVEEVDRVSHRDYELSRFVLRREIQPINLSLLVSPLMKSRGGGVILQPMVNIAIQDATTILFRDGNDAEGPGRVVVENLDYGDALIGFLPLLGVVIVDHHLRRGFRKHDLTHYLM